MSVHVGGSAWALELASADAVLHPEPVAQLAVPVPEPGPPDVAAREAALLQDLGRAGDEGEADALVARRLGDADSSDGARAGTETARPDERAVPARPGAVQQRRAEDGAVGLSRGEDVLGLVARERQREELVPAGQV